MFMSPCKRTLRLAHPRQHTGRGASPHGRREETGALGRRMWTSNGMRAGAAGGMQAGASFPSSHKQAAASKNFAAAHGARVLHPRLHEKPPCAPVSSARQQVSQGRLGVSAVKLARKGVKVNSSQALFLVSRWTGHTKFKLFGLSLNDRMMPVVISCNDSFSKSTPQSACDNA